MIDYFFKFASEAAAIADAAGSVYYQAGIGWNSDRVTPGLQVWRPSQDVVNADGSITHTYLAGWYGCISLSKIAPALINHAKLSLAIDRDLAAAGQPAIIQNNLGAILQDVMFSPVFAGSNYPFGNLQ